MSLYNYRAYTKIQINFDLHDCKITSSHYFGKSKRRHRTPICKCLFKSLSLYVQLHLANGSETGTLILSCATWNQS